jgi:HAMP domain-containing protein
MLTEYFSRYGQDFSVLSYANESGSEELKLINGQTVENLSNIRNSAIFKEAVWVPNKTVCSYSVSCSDIGNPCVEFGFFNKSFFDEFVGFISGKVPVLTLAGNMKEFRVGQSGSVVILDSEGTILVCRHKDKILKKITVEGPGSKQVISEIKALKSGFSRATILEVDAYIAYSPVPGQNWSVMVILPYEEFLTMLHSLRNITLLVGLAVFIVAAVLSLMLAANITRPILKLAAGTALIAEGDFTPRIDIKSKDEIEILAESFNRMAKNLKNTTTSIVNLNREITERKKAEQEISAKMKEIEEFNCLAVGWELRMIELKEEINRLLAERGIEPRYEVFK